MPKNNEISPAFLNAIFSLPIETETDKKLAITTVLTTLKSDKNKAVREHNEWDPDDILRLVDKESIVKAGEFLTPENIDHVVTPGMEMNIFGKYIAGFIADIIREDQ